MSELVACKIENGVALITLQNGKVNAISHEVIEQLHVALDRAEEEKAIVILTSESGLLSGGYDLKTMQASPEQAIALVTEGSKLTRRMLAFPLPIITATPGHAVAKGAFLLLCSDYRIGAAGDFKIGLNEVAIGITMHYAGLEMARFGLANAYFNRAVICAEMFQPEEAQKAGFLDRVVPADQVMATAMAVAEGMKGLNLRAHKGTKLKAREAVLEAMDKAIETDAKGTL
ncbi:MAG: crotonase/enoyl-CoA hydratase family protein [Oleiphilus sp.]|nr:MAG: crotonase/enoyl-CoA hydratase family protein [Oleiphilus sp.]